MFYRYLYLQAGDFPIGRWYKETTDRVAKILLPDNLMYVLYSSRYSQTAFIPDDGFDEIMDAGPALAFSGPDLFKVI